MIPWKQLGFWQRLIRLFHVRKTVTLVYRLFRDRRVPALNKGIFAGAVLLYLLVPTDIVPDLFPFLGQMDDLAVLLFFIDRFIANAPIHVVDELEKEGF